LEQTKHDFSFNRVTLPRTYLDSILFEDRHFLFSVLIPVICTTYSVDGSAGIMFTDYLSVCAYVCACIQAEAFSDRLA